MKNSIDKNDTGIIIMQYHYQKTGMWKMIYTSITSIHTQIFTYTL